MDRFLSECKEAIPQAKQKDIFSVRKHGIHTSPEEHAEIAELFRQKLAKGSTYPIVHELVQNLAFTVFLFEQRAGKKSAPN